LPEKYLHQTMQMGFLFFLRMSGDQGFLRCFRDPIRVPRIENWVPRIS